MRKIGSKGRFAMIVGLVAIGIVITFESGRYSADREGGQGGASGRVARSSSGYAALSPIAESPAAADAAGPLQSQGIAASEGPTALPASFQSAAQSDSSAPRKIVYTADIDLIVEDLTKAGQEIVRSVRRQRGYVAETNVRGSAGSPREGTWKVRVPVDRYDSFVDGIAHLGEVQTLTTGSEDVSMEYYDLAAREKAKRIEEDRLIGHLQHSTARLTDILAVERELSRVQSEIDQMESRIRFLSNQADLTTITLTVHEARSYVPPKPTTFATQILRSSNRSVAALATAAKACLIAAVMAIPWLLVLALLGLLARPFVRRRRPLPEAEASR